MVLDSSAKSICIWLYLGLTGKVMSWRSMTRMCFLAFSHQYQDNFSFQSHRLLSSHAFAEVRGEKTPERRVASTGDRTHNRQVMSPTRSPLSHPGGAGKYRSAQADMDRKFSLSLYFQYV